jgi:hypothetical protein
MDKVEMRALLIEHLASYRVRSYEDLVAAVETDRVETSEVKGTGGAEYQIEVCFFWDDKREGNVRAAGSIDEVPHRPLFGFLPIYVSAVNEDFIMRPDGTFVDE